jgi:hypothetical protein
LSKQIAPDIVSSFSRGKIQPLLRRDLLSQMIYHGKQLYLKDALPDYTDAEKMVFSQLLGVKRMRVICGVI